MYKLLTIITLALIITGCGAKNPPRPVILRPTADEGVFHVITDLATGELTTRMVDGRKRFVIQNIYLQDYLINSGEFLSEIEEMEDVEYRFENGQMFFILTLEQFDALIRYIFWQKREAEVQNKLEMH